MGRLAFIVLLTLLLGWSPAYSGETDHLRVIFTSNLFGQITNCG